MCKSAESPVCESHVPFGATIRYLLIAVHRRGLEQSFMGRSPRLFSVRQGSGTHCQTSSLHSNTREDSLILGLGRNAGGESVSNSFGEIRSGHHLLHYMAVWNNTQWNIILD